jgi:membrane-bound lytic murein transglycosylase B
MMNLNHIRPKKRRPLAIAAMLFAVLSLTAIGAGLRAQDHPADPSTWSISKEKLFTEAGDPLTPECTLLLLKLEAKGKEGARISRKEFLSLLKRPEAQAVYPESILRYATPLSLDNQSKSHVDLSKRLMSEENQQACLDFMQKQRKYLMRAEKRYHVSQQDIVGILTWESSLGRYTGNYRIFNVYLGQIVYLDQAQQLAVAKLVQEGKPNPLNDTVIAARERRRMMIRKLDAVNSLVALLRTAKKMKFDPLSMVGSWGGATGYVQFMPYNIKFAVDADGNGLNLKTWPDAIFSVANYLKQEGKYRQDSVGRKRAILRYNRNEEYANGVMALADTIWSRYRLLKTVVPVKHKAIAPSGKLHPVAAAKDSTAL